ncbi:MAG: hypothetical protein QM781_13605 [Chitinophagaceae bacterium]
MKRIQLLITGLIFSLTVMAQAELPLPKGSCGTKAMQKRYSTKAQIAGSGGDGKIIAVSSLNLFTDAVRVLSFRMLPGVDYSINIIMDRELKKGLAPHQRVAGELSSNGKYWKELGLQEGSDIFYDLGTASEAQFIDVSLAGTNYYDLRDADDPVAACAIVYVVERRPAGYTEPASYVKPTVVPSQKPKDKTELINNWADAQQKLVWSKLITAQDNEDDYRYFQDNSYLVVQKKNNYTWTTATLPGLNPFPAYWEYKATFNTAGVTNGIGNSGLALPAMLYNDKVIVFFLVSAVEQTYFFGYYNTNKNEWVKIYQSPPGENKSSGHINKLNEKGEATNTLALYRNGNTIGLYVNDKLLEELPIPFRSCLNTIQGIGLAGVGRQAYFVNRISFWHLQ